MDWRTSLLLLLVPSTWASDYWKFKCRYEDTRPDVVCISTLRIVGVANNKNYSLSMDSSPYHICKPPDANAGAHCTLPRPINSTGVKHNFTFAVEAIDAARWYEFHLVDDQMTRPLWGNYSPSISRRDNVVCVDGQWSSRNSNSTFKWRVSLLSNEAYDARIISHLEAGFSSPQDVCFRMPPYRYPQYEVRLWTRYNLTGSPWTKDYYSFNVSGNASVPDRPPKFVPNGFSYEPRSTELYVYWVGLSLLEFGGPDFTYILESDTG